MLQGVPGIPGNKGEPGPPGASFYIPSKQELPVSIYPCEYITLCCYGLIVNCSNE